MIEKSDNLARGLGRSMERRADFDFYVSGREIESIKVDREGRVKIILEKYGKTDSLYDGRVLKLNMKNPGEGESGEEIVSGTVLAANINRGLKHGDEYYHRLVVVLEKTESRLVRKLLDLLSKKSEI